MGLSICLDVAVTTKCRSGREACNALMTASLPTPLGPLITTFSGGSGGICAAPPDCHAPLCMHSGLLMLHSCWDIRSCYMGRAR